MKRKGVESVKGSKRCCKLSMVAAGIAVLLVSVAIAFASLAVMPVMAQEAEVTVTVNAPEYVKEKATFEVTIDVDDITNFNTGLFDLCFDRSVVKVTSVEDGEIGGTEIPVVMSKVMERETVRVFISVSGEAGVSGSGYLAKINFKVKGDEGDECTLDIDNGFLGNTTAEEIPADWIDAELTVGAGKKDKEGEELPPEITPLEPMEKEVSSIEGESMTFEIEVDPEADISWQINGTEVQTDEGETESDFKKDADAGIWNVSVIATSTETGLSSMHTWIWSVTATETEEPEGTPTPTPTLAPGETPKPKATPTLAPGETAKPAATPSSAEGKPKPTAPPGTEEKAKPTPKSAVPGFEVVFAIIGMLSTAYILQRRR